uniref:Uncharacterized protein n=1 Tax=Anguilla anguilla TaxID=7936 RepID=A0A0E9Q2K9_ANGAN
MVFIVLCIKMCTVNKQSFLLANLINVR